MPFPNTQPGTSQSWYPAEVVPGSDELPSYAGARSQSYNSRLSLYGSKSNIIPVTATMSKMLNSTGLTSILCVGDSQTAGYGATAGVSDWPIRLRKSLLNAGYTLGGTGWVFAYNGNVVPDSRWTFSNFSATGANRQYVTASSVGATATFTSDVPGTILDFSVGNSSGAFTYSIDAGAPVQFTASGALSSSVISVTGLTNATHTITFTTTSSASAYINAVRVRGTSGFQITNAGISSSKTTDWLATNQGSAYYNPRNTTFLLEPAPSLVILALGGNDAIQGTVASTITANLVTLINDWQTVAPVLPMWYFPFASASSSYVAAAYNAADSCHTGLIDHWDSLQTLANVNSLGLGAGDNLHPNANGYQFMAKTIKNVLLS